MRHPIQRLHFCPSTNRLFAAVAGVIHVFHGTTGVPIAEWTAPQLPVLASSKKNLNKPAKKEEEDATPAEQGAAREGSPSKKRKVDEKAEPIRTSNLGVGAPRDGQSGKNSVTKMLSVREGGYLVVVTNEDKTLRVLEFMEDGGLKMLSERAMPKRLCAVYMVDSDLTILLADKFGDVYAIPLLEEVVQPRPENPTAAQLAKEERERLAEIKRKRTEISHDLPFTAQLLLGHVSMLVDVLAVTIPEEGKDRMYVLTADRDEHIRVSRYPQCFVIEGFCLGHEAFVSKMLVPSWDKAQLISGGGDAFLLRWDWRNRAVLEKVDVADLVRGVVGGKVGGGKHDHGDAERSGGEKEFKITVIGMWEVPELKMLVVAFESVPAVYIFTLSSSLVHTVTFPLSGHPLDVAVDTSNNAFYVSVVPASEGAPTIEKFIHAMDQWENVTERDDSMGKIMEKTDEAQFVGDEKILNEGLLYATGLLRKGTARAEKE